MLDPVLELFRGKAVTIPPMDGAFRSNLALEEAAVLATCAAPDNLVVSGGGPRYSSGANVLALDGNTVVAGFDAPITALAASHDGTLAVALETGRIVIRQDRAALIDGFKCPVAMAFDGPNDLYVCNGSDVCAPSHWVSDLMHKGASGSLWHVSLSNGQRTCLARGLAFPYGLVIDTANDRIVVSESWRHRLIAIPTQGGAPVPVFAKLPGYPARLSARPAGGYLLSLFAPRNRLIEFVLQEDAYRADMMREIDPRHWIAPALSASRSFLEPLQSGGVRSMGIHKPWSPSRSYGLIAELDADFQPTSSHHSRANGQRHGITSAIDHAGRIVATSKGSDAVLAMRMGRH